MTPGISPRRVLRPSSAPRWGVCAGSDYLESLYPDLEDSPEAREGTAGHYYPTEYLQGRAWPVGTLAPNGHPIDADMITHGQVLIEDVYAAFRTCGPEYDFRVETMVRAHLLIHPDNEGTPDVFLIDWTNRRLIVWDYKYGHKYVDAFRNLQVLDYVAGIIETAGIVLDAFVAHWSVSFRVIQPRNYHRDGAVRRWDTTGAVVWPMIQTLSAAAHLARTPNAPVATGPQCTDCNGRHACEAFARVAAHCLDVSGQSVPQELPPSALGLELKRIATALKRLEARRDGLQAQALAMIAGGKNVPFWAKGFVDSRERWAVPLAEVVAMGELMGVNLRKDDAITPNQARALGIDATVIAAYAVKPKGAAKLIPSDETTAEKAFSQGTK